MIVYKKDLSTSKIEFNAEFEKLKEELFKYRYNKTAEINGEILQKQQELKALNERLKRFEPLAHLVDYFEGNCKLAVVDSYYGAEIRLVGELTTKDNNDRPENKLQAFTVRRTKDSAYKNTEFQFMVSRYNDGSGDTTRAYLFSTMEEALVKYKELWTEKMKNSADSGPTEEDLKKLAITDQVFWDRVNLRKENDKKRILAEREKALKEYMRLKAKVDEL